MISVCVEVDEQEVLEEMTDEELLDYMNEREIVTLNNDTIKQLDKIYHLRREGRDYQVELDNLIYDVIGRIN